MSDPGGPMMVPLPEPIGRKARLGPFPTGRDALKFASYAGLGAVVAGATAPVLWLPFLGAGLMAGVVRFDGKGIDAHLADYVRFRLRARPGQSLGGTAGRRGARGSIARVAPGRFVSVVAVGGIPVAFLPSRDARELFDGYRAFLRTVGSGLRLQVITEPVSGNAWRPRSEEPATAGERAARGGYDEMVQLVVRHRRRRVVRLATWVSSDGPGSVQRLEEQTQGLIGQLLALGLAPRRLQGRELDRALASFGWGGASG
jgi:hypothetical protein